MARYIDAEIMPKDSFFEELTYKEKAKVIQWLLQSPTADVVPVVRCKDCKHLGDCHMTVAKRMKIDSKGNIAFETNLNHYCSFGERKDDNGNL